MTTELHSLRIDPSLKQARSAPARRRWPIWAGVAAVVIVAILIWLLRPPAAIEVEVARVALVSSADASASLSDAVALNATGYIVAAHKIELAAKVVGRVSWVGVEIGDKVKKGQVLVRLEDDEYRARLLQQQGQYHAATAKLAELTAGSRPQEIDRARADLDEASADMENARVTVERDRGLAATHALSQQTIDDAEAKYQSARAKVNSLKATFELSRIGVRQEQIDAQKAQVEETQGMLDLTKVDLANTLIYAP
ncbi:MAG TPA: biotin/lipoyl-binding protein, partial [Bradyrhizobium sp.]